MTETHEVTIELPVGVELRRGDDIPEGWEILWSDGLWREPPGYLSGNAYFQCRPPRLPDPINPPDWVGRMVQPSGDVECCVLGVNTFGEVYLAAGGWKNPYDLTWLPDKGIDNDIRERCGLPPIGNPDA